MNVNKQLVFATAVALCTFGVSTLRGQDLTGELSSPAVDLTSPIAQAQSMSDEPELVPTPAKSILQANGMYQSGWGTLRADGSLHGRVVSAAGPQASTSISIMSGDNVVATATSDENGGFVLSGLQSGMHTLKASGNNAYAVYSLMLQPGNGDNSEMDVYCAAMPPAEAERYVSEMWAPGNWFETPTNVNVPLVGSTAPSTQSVQVAMNNGVVNGQLLFPSPNWAPQGHMVKAFRGGQLIATAPADEYGRFSFDAASAGPVDLVAGGGAYGAMSIEVVDGTQVANAADVCVVPLVGEGVITEEVVAVDQLANECCAPMGGCAGGGFGGGFGGGGGGGFGGGWGGLLGAAGLALGIAALADDEDDGFNFNIPTPIAP